MTIEILLFLFIALAVLLLFVECATEAMDAFRFFFYKGNSTASVVTKEPFSVSRSKRLVEQNENRRGYSPVGETQDRNSNYPYVLSPAYWMYKKKDAFPVLEWETKENTWRAHYPYARKWTNGSQVMIRYNAACPWKYAVRDSSLGVSVLLKCLFYLLCIAIFSILLMARIRG